MPELLTDDRLRHKVLAVLQDQLGPIEALRFLAMVRRGPFDYETWREKCFGNLSLDELFHQMQQTEAGSR
jgi:hypothetical protein